MNVVFFSTNPGCEGLQEWLIGKLQALHGRDHNIAGAQVDFFEEDVPGGAGNAGTSQSAKVCTIDLHNYGEPISVRQSAVSYEQAAQDAVTELTRKVEQAAVV